jgi:NDP-sugar pyrophosphorylase family protein
VSNLSEIDVLVLCGGFGKRLQPVIYDVPKVMAEINQRPFLDMIVGHLETQGFEHIILATGYKKDSIRFHFESQKRKAFVEYSEETKPLGTGGAIHNARFLLRSDTFIVVNGDSFCPLSYKPFIVFSKNHFSSVVVSMVDNAKDYGTVRFDSTKQVQGFEEKAYQGSGYVNAGIYCFNRNVLRMFYEPCSLEKDILPPLARQQFLHAYVTDRKFFDIGTPERYVRAQKKLQRGQHS